MNDVVERVSHDDEEAPNIYLREPESTRMTAKRASAMRRARTESERLKEGCDDDDGGGSSG